MTFRTIDCRTAKSFEKKGYKVFHTKIGEWIIYLPNEKVPKEPLRKGKSKRKYIKRLPEKIDKIIKGRKKLKKKKKRKK